MRKDLEDFYERLKDCKRCELCKWGDNRFGRQRGAGNDERNGIVVVAINPGKAWRVGDAGPFTVEAMKNTSARNFCKALEKAGYNRNHFFVTNLVKCSIEQGNPSQRHVEACSINLKEELSLFDPMKIITVGNLPKEHFKVNENRIINGKEIQVSAVHHPLYYRYVKGGLDIFSEDLKKAIT